MPGDYEVSQDKDTREYLRNFCNKRFDVLRDNPCECCEYVAPKLDQNGNIHCIFVNTPCTWGM